MLLSTYNLFYLSANISSHFVLEDANYRSGKKLDFMAFYYRSYKKELYFWEIVETVRRMSLTSLLVLVDRQYRVALATALSVVFLALHMHFQPYLEQRNNDLQTRAGIAITLTFVLFAGMQSELLLDSHWEGISAGICLMVYTCVLFIFVIRTGVRAIQHRKALNTSLDDLLVKNLRNLSRIQKTRFGCHRTL